jgi:hypothetical protein
VILSNPASPVLLFVGRSARAELNVGQSTIQANASIRGRTMKIESDPNSSHKF